MMRSVSRVILLLTASLAPAAWAQTEGNLTVSPTSGVQSGVPTTFTWSGTLRPKNPPPSGFDCGKLKTSWSIGTPVSSSGGSGFFFENSGSGDTFTVTLPAGGWYSVHVALRYENSGWCEPSGCYCDGGGSGGKEFYAGGSIFTGFGVVPEPVFVDRGASLYAVGNIPYGATAKFTHGDGTSSNGFFSSGSADSDHAWKTPGTYAARVTVTNPPLCTSSGPPPPDPCTDYPVITESKDYRVVVKPDLPTAAASFSPSPPTAGQPVQFNAVVGGGERDRTLLWDFGDGTTSTVPNPTHTFAANDDYVVSLTVTNAWGSAQWEYSPFTVLPASGGTPPESASFSWTPPSPVTQQLVSFLDKSKGSITRWRWNFDAQIPPGPLASAPLSYEQNPTFTYTQPGRKNVELWVSNRFGRKGIIFFVDVLRHDVPPLGGFNFTPFNVRVGEPVQFTDTSFGGTSWLWNLGEDGATSTQQNPSYTYRTTGQKSVTLKVSNAFGSDTVTKFFPCDEGTGSALAANFTWSPQTPNPGEPVRFSDLSTGSPEKWSWVVSDGAQSNERNFTHTFLQAGEYAVSLRVDKGTQTKILVQIVKVGASPSPTPNFTFTPGSPRPGEEVTFVNLSSNATSYLWDFDDGTTSTSVEPKHTFTAEKTYKVKLTATGGSESESITKNVVVSAAGATIPVAQFTIAPNPAQVGKPVQFTDTSTGQPAEWFWDFGYSSLTSREQNPEHTFPFAATFQVKLTVKNSKGTSTPLTLPVIVKNDLPKPVPDFTWLPGSPAEGEVVTFTDKSSNQPKEWQWTFGDGGSARGAVVTHAFATAGSWNVTLKVSNVSGEATVSRTVVVTKPRLEADFKFTPASPKSGDKVFFTDQSRGAPESWKWVIDGIDFGTDRNITRTFYEGGEHVVELQVRRAGEQSFKSKEVLVAAPPVASFRAGGKLNTGVLILFTDISAGNPTQRTWFINGKSAGTAATISRTFKEAGPVQVRLLVENEIGSDAVTRNFTITSSPLERPVIRKLSAEYGPCFFKLLPVTSNFAVDVDWRQQRPESIELEINGVAEPSTKAESVETFLKLDSKDLDYSEPIGENELLFTARGNLGFSDPMKLAFFSINTPGYLQFATVRREITETSRKTLLRGLYLPPQPLTGEIKFPDILGGQRFGLKNVQFKLEEQYRTDCTVKRIVEIGGGIILGKEGGFSAYGGLKGIGMSETTLSKRRGSLESQKFSLGIEGFIGVEKEMSAVELLPGLTVMCGRPVVSEICKAISVKVDLQGSLGGLVEFTLDDEGGLNFLGANNTGALQLLATGTLGPGSAKLEFFGGGKGTVKYSQFSPPFIRKAEIGIEFGARLVLFGSVTEQKALFMCTYEPDKEFICVGDPLNLLIDANAAMSLRPVRPLARTEEVEVEGDAAPVLLGNVTSLADPAAAARGEQSMVVYLSENESSGASLQRLDIRSMRRNGSDAWSAPKSLTSDSIGDFNPNVVLLPNGRAVAAWERIRNPAFSYADIPTLDDMPKLLREVEIAVATNDAGSDTWSSPAVLTSNDFYDHQPALAALSDGRTILTWIREPADGASAQQIVARALQGETWSAESVVAGDLRGVSELTLAAKGNEAQLVVSRDRDGDTTTDNHDLALFVFRNDAWSARVDVTNDADNDRSPAVIYDGDAARVYWTRGGKLVTRALPDGAIENVRTLEGRSGVAAPVPAVRPDGAQGVVWSSGSDLRAVLRDPQTKQWTSDIILTDESTSHSSLTAFFTPDNTLHLISLGTAIGLRDVSKTTLAVPTPGRTDLLSFDKTMHVDLAARGETLAADPRQPNAGEAVTIRIDLENAGLLPVRNAVVELRRGETTIATTTVAGDWMPGVMKPIELTTTYDPAVPQLTVVVDPTGDAVPANNVARFSFANRAPAACFQASAGSGGNPLTVTFDAACSIDSDGRIARYAWAFGETGGTSGRSASHTFATAGTHTVILTVTDEMGASSTRSMTIDVAAPKDWRSADAPYSLYLSVVGRSSGLGGSFFVSDVAILNTDFERDLNIDAVYMPDGRSDAYHRTITLRGGELLQTRDVVAQLFEATNGSGSVRLDLSHPHAVAVARTYNDQPSGTAGFSNEALQRSASLTDGEKGVILQHWLPGYRTNIGFTEVGGAPAVVKATAFDEQGATLGSEEFTLGAYAHTQINGRPLFQSRGRIEIEVRGGAVLAYGSTIDGMTGDPIYQTADRVPGGTTSRALLVPVVARLTGVANSTWRSDVRVFNPNSSSQSATMELRTGGGTFTAPLQLAAGATASFDDVIASAFPQVTGNVGGALTILAPAPLMATSRTFNVTPTGTYGLYVPSRSREELIGQGENAWLVQLVENADYRCNLGITSFDEPVEVSVRAFDAAGTTLATRRYSVAAGQNAQIGRVFADMGAPLPLDAAGLEVTVIEGRAFIYASVNDNRTNDGTFIEAQR